jgi:hypothetical protein
MKKHIIMSISILVVFGACIFFITRQTGPPEVVWKQYREDSVMYFAIDYPAYVEPSGQVSKDDINAYSVGFGDICIVSVSPDYKKSESPEDRILGEDNRVLYTVNNRTYSIWFMKPVDPALPEHILKSFKVLK